MPASSHLERVLHIPVDCQSPERSNTSGIFSMMSIIIAHVITGVYLCQPWLEPFTGLEDILRYGAMPRCLQYIGCVWLICMMMNG